MIYFLTDWQAESTQLESNIVFNVNKILNEGEITTKIINTQLSPFSNYFTNPFEFYDSDHFIYLMDAVTDRVALCYAPLTMSDLQFPRDWERTYTRGNVLLSKDGLIKAEVLFNSFGFVSQVHYHTRLGKEVQIYSEKGVLLCQRFIDSSGEEIEQRIFDESGQLILTKWNEYVFIAQGYKKRFKQANYQTFKMVCAELLSVALTNFDPKEDRLIVDGRSEWLMELVEGFKFSDSIVYIFSGPTQVCLSQVSHHFKMIEKGKRVITDNLRFQKEIKKGTGTAAIQNKLHYMPLYPTTLMLGESNNFLEAVIYWQIEHFDSQVSDLLKAFLQMKLTIRELCLIIESGDESDEMKLDAHLTNFITQNFEINLTSSEYGLVKKYYEAIKNEELTPALRELFQMTKQENPEFKRVIDAYLFYTGVTFKKSSSVQIMKEEFQKVRVYIDQRETDDFLSHSLAVSAGIPILSKVPSPYLVDGKNGLIYKEDESLVEAVKHYLSDPDQWNQSLVESVDVIESNSADGLVKKWKEVLK